MVLKLKSKLDSLEGVFVESLHSELCARPYLILATD